MPGIEELDELEESVAGLGTLEVDSEDADPGLGAGTASEAGAAGAASAAGRLEVDPEDSEPGLG